MTTHEEAVASIITRVAETTGWGTDCVRPGLAREMAKQILAALDLPGYTHAETIGEVRAIAQGESQ